MNMTIKPWVYRKSSPWIFLGGMIALGIVGAFAGIAVGVLGGTGSARFAFLATWLLIGVFVTPISLIAAIVWAVVIAQARPAAQPQATGPDTRTVPPHQSPQAEHALSSAQSPPSGTVEQVTQQVQPPSETEVPGLRFVPTPRADAMESWGRPEIRIGGRPRAAVRARIDDLTFTAIDFETANEQRASACAVGITTVSGGTITHSESFYIYPPTGLEFTNSHIHQITAEHVADAEPWASAASRILDLADGSPLVAYSSFDRGVWNAAWSYIGEPVPEQDFRDALQLAKRHLTLKSFKLPEVARELSLPEFDHHDPAADALTCAQIVLELAALAGHTSLDDLWQTPRNRKPARTLIDYGDEAQAKDLVVNEAADPSHPLYGETVCFSGKLEGLSRAEAQRQCAALGANVTANVTKKTTLLVEGGFDPATLRAGATTSSKVEKALEYGLPVIDESEFMRLVQGERILD